MPYLSPMRRGAQIWGSRDIPCLPSPLATAVRGRYREKPWQCRWRYVVLGHRGARSGGRCGLSCQSGADRRAPSGARIREACICCGAWSAQDQPFLPLIFHRSKLSSHWLRFLILWCVFAGSVDLHSSMVIFLLDDMCVPCCDGSSLTFVTVFLLCFCRLTEQSIFTVSEIRTYKYHRSQMLCLLEIW
jgi:hypothetical protein